MTRPEWALLMPPKVGGQPQEISSAADIGWLGLAFLAFLSCEYMPWSCGILHLSSSKLPSRACGVNFRSPKWSKQYEVECCSRGLDKGKCSKQAGTAAVCY